MILSALPSPCCRRIIAGSRQDAISSPTIPRRAICGTATRHLRWRWRGTAPSIRQCPSHDRQLHPIGLICPATAGASHDARARHLARLDPQEPHPGRPHFPADAPHLNTSTSLSLWPEQWCLRCNGHAIRERDSRSRAMDLRSNGATAPIPDVHGLAAAGILDGCFVIPTGPNDLWVNAHPEHGRF